MILVGGIASEPPLARVRQELERLGTPVVFFDQRRFAAAELGYRIAAGNVTGVLRIDDRHHRLEDFTGTFLRLMDDQALPETRREPPGSPARRYARSLHDALVAWSDLAAGRVVNRTAPMASNGSKPYQAQLIRSVGLRVPETLVTTEPELVHDFLARHRRLVYKSISGFRSIVQELRPADLGRLGRIRWCPAQFQQLVEGTDIRVHVIGMTPIATAVTSDTIDYRYAYRDGGSLRLAPAEIDDDLAERCVALAGRLGLAFAGIDLKLTSEGEAYCFEVNPSPAFTFYEDATGQPIARAVARYLTGE